MRRSLHTPPGNTKSRWPRAAAALVMGLGVSLAIQPSARGDQAADAASVAEHERALRMQRFIVSATRVDKNPWRYASLPGFEILSRAPLDETTWLLDSLRRGLWLQNDVLPKDWLPENPVAYTVIIDDTDMSTVPVAEIHSQPIKLKSPDDSIVWGSMANGTVIWTDHLPSYDSDTLAFNTNIYGVDFKTLSYGSISLDRLGRCVPALPTWLLAGLLGPEKGIFREGFVPVVSEGIFGPGWIHKASGPGTVWVSLDETQRLLDQINFNRSRNRTTPVAIPPLRDLFGEEPPPSDGSALWESEAALFVRWGLMGPGSQDPATAHAFLELVRRARREPVTEQVFTDCFGFGYAVMEEKLGPFLCSVLAKPTTVELDMPARFPRVVLRTATADQIGRVLGDWLRMQGSTLRKKDPDLSKEALYYAGRMLARAYRDDNGLSPDTNPDRGRGQVEDSPQGPNRGSATRMKPFIVTADRIHDPRLLSVYGLYEHDEGDDAKAREFLEAAVKSGVMRPSAYVTLAFLRYSEAMGKPAGPEGKISSQQATSILEPLKTALKSAPEVDVFGILVGTWSNCEARPSEADIEQVERGVELYPRNTDLAYMSAVLCAQSGFPKQAAKLIDKGLVFTTHEGKREYFEQLRTSLGAPQVPAAN